MKSHEYHFGFTDVARLMGPLLIPVLIFAGIMHLGRSLKLLPSPWPTLEVDHTILTHQARSSMTPQPADVLFIGDSSCLMDISPTRLDAAYRRQHTFLNLGTFMYLGWNGYAAMVNRYAAANPGRLRTIIVFVHPEMLRAAQPISHYPVFLSNLYAGADQTDSSSVRGQLMSICGLNIFEDRLLSRLPLPLPKEYGRVYGFNLDLDKFMLDHGGHVADPHQYRPGPGQGNAGYRITTAVEPGCNAIKAAVPPQAQVLFALAPIPESFAPPGYPAHNQRLLANWSQVAHLDPLLTNLPPTMSDEFFAGTTHLNAKGSSRYSEILANALRPYLVR